MAKKNILEQCCICKDTLKNTEKMIKVKEKMLYEDNDGVWYNFKTSYICSSCLTEVRKKVKGEA